LGEIKHVYRYSFTRATAGGAPKEVWACFDADFGDGLSTGVTTVLDAAVEGDHLIVALQSGIHYYAQVLDSKRDPLVNNESVLLFQPGGLRPMMVTGGSISGSLAEGTLAVHLHRRGRIFGVEARTLTFRLTKVNNAYQWVLEQPAPKPATAPTTRRAESQR